jgi:hypothetical protein
MEEKSIQLMDDLKDIDKVVLEFWISKQDDKRLRKPILREDEKI